MDPQTDGIASALMKSSIPGQGPGSEGRPTQAATAHRNTESSVLWAPARSVPPRASRATLAIPRRRNPAAQGTMKRPERRPWRGREEKTSETTGAVPRKAPAPTERGTARRSGRNRITTVRRRGARKTMPAKAVMESIPLREKSARGRKSTMKRSRVPSREGAGIYRGRRNS